jgi:hypothetical protein
MQTVLKIDFLWDFGLAWYFQHSYYPVKCIGNRMGTKFKIYGEGATKFEIIFEPI